MRHHLLTAVAIAAIACTAACAKRGPKPKDYARELQPGELALTEVDIGELPAVRTTPALRRDLERGIDACLAHLAKPSVVQQYAHGVSGIPREQVVDGLKLMRELLRRHVDDASLDREIRARFRAYSSVGWDGKGSVLFTGYFTPIYEGSLTRTAEFRHPVYARPKDLAPNPDPTRARTEPSRSLDGNIYPTRAEIEDGRMLAGTELVWFKERWQAYVIEVQGSGLVRTSEGPRLIGYADTNGHPYVSVGKELAADGKIDANAISMPAIDAYFAAHPEELDAYIRRNPRMVFFRFSDEAGPMGSTNTPVLADVSVATDKSIFPPAALCVADAAAVPNLRLDQDTGGAIRAPGRCDLYMGIGPEAERRAGAMHAEGRLFYLVPR